jgi:hypothetical protein
VGTLAADFLYLRGNNPFDFMMREWMLCAGIPPPSASPTKYLPETLVSSNEIAAPKGAGPRIYIGT